MRKAKPHTRNSTHYLKTVIIQDSSSDSFSHSDNDFDFLIY